MCCICLAKLLIFVEAKTNLARAVYDRGGKCGSIEQNKVGGRDSILSDYTFLERLK